jgi:hypothetical protein
VDSRVNRQALVLGERLAANIAFVGPGSSVNNLQETDYMSEV